MHANNILSVFNPFKICPAFLLIKRIKKTQYTWKPQIVSIEKTIIWYFGRQWIFLWNLFSNSSLTQIWIVHVVSKCPLLIFLFCWEKWSHALPCDSDTLCNWLAKSGHLTQTQAPVGWPRAWWMTYSDYLTKELKSFNGVFSSLLWVQGGWIFQRTTVPLQLHASSP